MSLYINYRDTFNQLLTLNFVMSYSMQIAKSSHSTPYNSPTNQHHLSTYSGTLGRQLSGGGHVTSGQLRNRNVSTFSPAHASTGGNELLLRASSKRESSMREQLFAKVNNAIIVNR